LTVKNKLCIIKDRIDQKRQANSHLPVIYLLYAKPLVHSLPYSKGDKNIRIAVLDDNPTIGEMLHQGLELAGHTVVIYSSPSRFLVDIIGPTTASTPFDLIIVDLFLPERISGVEVIQQVRNTLPYLPVILISAGGSSDIEAATRALPEVGVLRKPFKIATLLRMIKDL
jgi:DNA-binding response OmpR family regulator